MQKSRAVYLKKNQSIVTGSKDHDQAHVDLEIFHLYTLHTLFEFLSVKDPGYVNPSSKITQLI